MKKEVYWKRCGTCRWRDLRYGGNQEPDDTLKNWEQRQWLEGIAKREQWRPYLFPKEASNTKFVTAIIERAKQSNEHSDKYDGVGDEGNDEGRFDIFDVEYDTSSHNRVPSCAKLQINKTTWSRAVEFDYSPARPLIQNHVVMGFSIVYRRVEGKGLALDDN